MAAVYDNFRRSSYDDSNFDPISPSLSPTRPWRQRDSAYPEASSIYGASTAGGFGEGPAGALEAHGRRAVASAEHCLGQLGQLLEAIDLPCDPRRKPPESAPHCHAMSPEASGAWSSFGGHSYGSGCSSREGVGDWSPNPGRHPGSFRQAAPESPTPPCVGGGRGSASRTPQSHVCGSSRAPHVRKSNAALTQSAGGGGSGGGGGGGGGAIDHGDSRDPRVTFSGMSLNQVSKSVSQ